MLFLHIYPSDVSHFFFQYPFLADFYREHDTGVLMCESYAIASFIAQSLESDEVIGNTTPPQYDTPSIRHILSQFNTSFFNTTPS